MDENCPRKLLRVGEKWVRQLSFEKLHEKKATKDWSANEGKK